jgi:hypothetical protein
MGALPPPKYRVAILAARLSPRAVRARPNGVPTSGVGFRPFTGTNRPQATSELMAGACSGSARCERHPRAASSASSPSVPRETLCTNFHLIKGQLSRLF